MSDTSPPPPPDSSGATGPTDPSGSTPPGSTPPGSTPPGYGAPPPPGGYGGGYGYAPPPYGAPRNSGKAVTALVIGVVSPVLGLCCAFFGLVGIAAILVGRSAKAEIAMSGGRLTGAGMAQAGIVLGIIGCVLGLVMTAVNIALISSGTFELNPVP